MKRRHLVDGLNDQLPVVKRAKQSLVMEPTFMPVYFQPAELDRLLFLRRTQGIVPYILWATDECAKLYAQKSEIPGSICLAAMKRDGSIYQLFCDRETAVEKEEEMHGPAGRGIVARQLFHGMQQFSCFQVLILGLLPKMGRPITEEWIQVDARTKKLMSVGHIESSLYRALVDNPLGEPRLLLMIVSFLGSPLID